MVNTYSTSMEKVTINMSSELKELDKWHNGELYEY